MLVQFTSTEADQMLLAAVEQALAANHGESDGSFSDLCKAALRQMLCASPTPNSAPSNESPALEDLRRQVQQLAERLTHLEQLAGSPAAPPAPEADSLLSRLAPLLEDF